MKVSSKGHYGLLALAELVENYKRRRAVQVKEIANPGVTSAVLENLTPATWYFSVRAYASTGTESPASNTATKTIQ